MWGVCILSGHPATTILEFAKTTVFISTTQTRHKELHACLCAKSLQWRTLCDPMDCSLPGSSVHWILQARILEWVVMPPFPIQGSNLCLLGLLLWQVGSLPLAPPGKPYIDYQFSSVIQPCPTLCEPMHRSTPGLPVHHQLLEFTHSHVHRVGESIRGTKY